jgi:hypothetical protein
LREVHPIRPDVRGTWVAVQKYGVQIMWTRLVKSARRFGNDVRGGAAMQSALLFGGIGVAMALLLAPQLRDASERYAMDHSMGIDRTMTGSIDRDAQSKRYVIRKSVLDGR